jgi:hypothetical protein
MKYQTLFTFVFAIIFSACNENEDMTPMSTDCTNNYTTPANNLDSNNFAPPCPAISYERPGRYEYYEGCFNPLSNNQIAFVRADKITLPIKLELCTFNFCTGELKVLTDKCRGLPSWGAKNRIAFWGPGSQIWMIKPDGDSLTQLTNNGFKHTYSKWNPEGNLLMYWENNPFFNHVISDLKGLRLDTIESIVSPTFDWDGESLYYTNAKSGTGYNFVIEKYNIYTGITSKIDTFFRDSPLIIPNAISFDINRKKIFWTSTFEFAETDMDGNRRLLSKMPNDNWYYHLDVSGDGTKIIVERIDRKNPQPCVVEELNRLYLIDSDGKNERLIVFPE